MRLLTILYIILAVGLLSSCSTTKNLAAEQQLYTGQKKLQVDNDLKTQIAQDAMTEIEAALAKAPNNSLFGSSSIRTPLPFGLWFYNGLVNKKRGLGKWFFKKLAAKPVYISTVNPELRAKVATNLLHDYGFFNGTVSSEVITSKKDERKASVQYKIDMRNAYFLDSIEYRLFPDKAMTLIHHGAIPGRRNRTYLRKGDQFSVINLEQERERLSTLLRNRGFYYFRPDYIGYRADTTRVSGLVDLQIQPKSGLPENAKKQWYIGNITVDLYGIYGQQPNDSLEYDSIKIRYYNKLNIRPKVLKSRFRMESGQMYSLRRSTITQQRLAELGIFNFSEFQYTPRDSVGSVLDLRVSAGFDLPYDSELELNVATKSNDYAGPGVAYGITKRNVFRGGETFNIRVNGSYEWQTKSSGGSNTKINSYELGLSSSLTFPRIVFPHIGKKEWDFPATTTFSLNLSQLNRAKFFKMLSFGGDATYNFQPTSVSKHSFTPLKLTFNVLQHRTAEFDSIMNVNRALQKSMEDQFIPAMSYTYTYDDTSVRRRRNRFWLQSSITSAGNITSGVWALFGKKFEEEKKLMNASLAQFIKLTTEIRYTWVLDRNQSIATRFYSGVIYAYGSKTIAPYSEQFYIGGANSIRAFTIRTIGPGNYQPADDNKYSYLDQTGDIRLEANVEYRFRLIKDLHGAIFLDAGNIWTMREDESRPGGKFSLNNIGENIALGTGAGLRYDLSFLIIRVDCGVALHMPYTTSKSGYYNVPRFKDGLGLHLAIGYPF
ncbi:hypothetical protein D0T50_13270 [Bacteroides sp. 214]|uniref:translocation and assembly module lipoprotein TamL n=1 Tax=Bacteroides sp. 214 TaxID=2302935 RepID=UPI0013D64C87|nr:BamA/TamA family outer membrane protein [Bacteroides sp. 214]NDW13852.1 hypothetical protein [Bacteroides sp. 214]